MTVVGGQYRPDTARASGASESPRRIRIGPRHLIGFVLAILLGLYLASGFYVVNADERGVVRRFGAVSARVGPGMHYRIPWPVDRVDVLKTTSVMKIEVGASVPDGQPQTAGMELLTGDTNLLSVALVLQYIIRDPSDFLLQIEQPQELLENIARSILTEAVVSMPIDEVLTTGRLATQSEVKRQTQEILDRYRSGIQITSVSIMNMTLDRAVAQAFQDVADAMADREKMRNEALAYMNDLIPRARGEAQGTMSDAQNYRERHVAEAVGNTDRFLALLREYEKAPDITRARLYLEAMEKTLPKVKMYVTDSQNGRVPLNLRVTSP